MRYLLDTTTCIDVIREKPKAVVARLCGLPADVVGISAITLSELELGVSQSTDPERNRRALTKFLSSLPVLPYDATAARHYGAVRADLEARGLPIGSLDMLIAAHALSLGLTVVTSNEREFRRVPGLLVENWRG